MSTCSSCGKRVAGTLRPCSQGCGIASYCNRKCQKAHHREHKKACQSACQAATKEKSGLVGSEPHIPREGLLNPSYVDFRTDVRREALKAHMHNKWLHVFDIYDRPLVLHYDSRVVVNPPTDVEYFVGVYLPMKPTEEDVLPFPRFERDDYYTRKLFSAFHTMTNGEKSLLRKDGRSLNSHTYFRSTNYQVGVHCFLEMRPDFSVQASHLTDTIIRSGKHPPVRWEPFDEWIYSSPNPKVRLKVAMTPLDIFFDPLTARRSSIYELLREAPELALCPSPGHKMEPGAPVEWFKTIFGVYQATEKLIYGDMRGPHKGWIRDPHASYSLTQIDSHADRRLCLYFDTVEEQFLIRPLHSEGFIFEDCPPDMTSLSLPPRGYLEGFDGKHPEMLVSNWKGYLRGEKEMIIPLILAPKECFISIRLQHKLWDGVREVGETEGVMGPAPRYETDDFEITEAVPQTPVAKKKKRKKRKKKKNGDGATVNPLMSTANIAMPSSPSDSNATTEKPNGGLKNPLPIHSIRCQEQVKDIPEAENIDRHKRRVEYPIAEDDNGRGKEEPPLYTKNKDQAVSTDIASKNEALDLKSMDRQEHRAQSNEAHIIDAAAEEPCDAISIATRIDTICQWLQKELEDRAPQVETPTKELTWLCLNTEYCIGDVVFKLFDTKIRGFDKPLWLYAQESMTATILEKILSLGEDSKEGFEPARGWIRQNAMPLFEYCVENHRMMDMIALVGNRKAVPFVTEKMACQICGNLLESRGGSELGNKLAMAIPMIQLDSMQGGKLVKKCAANKLSKKAASALSNALRKGENALKKLQREAKKKGDPSGDFGTNSSSTAIEMRSTGIDKGEGAEQTGTHDVAQGDVSHYQRKIDSSMTWYVKLLEDCRHVDFRKAEKNNPESHTDEGGTESASPIAKQFAKSSKIVTSEQIAAAMARCSELPEDKAEEIISDVEMALDLSNWSIASEWIVEITEQAHKWFRKRSKKQNHMCERVARRLQLLSTGRWPYVLCKPVRTSSNSLSNLYESKIDSASRILWEVAISFSPRRSSGGKFFCEQVIRVWDIVEDHDNLTRAIARAVRRIEKSHIRGKECKIFSQLEDFDETSSQAINDIKQVVPKVFGMKQGIEGLESPQEGVYFAPANDDEKQFNLLKFYELNERAVELLLDEKADDMDLPFTPGPLEHEIIHYRTTPKRSILLMGRSGTGKTTCLVFRMWAQYMAYIDKNKGAKPRQLFLTKNDILRTEVEKSFNHMGLAWRNRGLTEVEEGGEVQDISSANNSSDTSIEFPLFLTSSEWLDLLDGELSGERFFSTDEIEQRKGSRDEDDAVHRGMEKFFSNDKTANTEQNNAARRQMTFGRFCDLWPKMKSRVKTTMDPALVWLEIKSHIKGCVSALRVNLCGNDRFLKRDEYLALPRKQSRIDRQLREVVYDLYLVYEQLKKGKFYDEMDIVFNLARRLPSDSNEVPKRMQGFLPVDAVFIDEVQDFTQSELYLITKLCSDPNNLMLAGDTAQSIAVGVGFRFTDVRQIFYNAFGGIEPKLLSLTHNYRSHSGILQLAASVVELLYFFFSDSLDRLPPDFGLFPGPKPVIMEVSSVADLVLMLDGSKRETSRIEFGAHQVVIVRNEEAKKALGDEFGVDKDWVMTVSASGESIDLIKKNAYV